MRIVKKGRSYQLVLHMPLVSGLSLVMYTTSSPRLSRKALISFYFFGGTGWIQVAAQEALCLVRRSWSGPSACLPSGCNSRPKFGWEKPDASSTLQSTTSFPSLDTWRKSTGPSCVCHSSFVLSQHLGLDNARKIGSLIAALVFTLTWLPLHCVWSLLICFSHCEAHGGHGECSSWFSLPVPDTVS